MGFSSMIVSTSAWVARGAHSLHSLPSVAMTSVKLSVSSCTCTQDSPFLTESIGVQVSMVLAACVSHSVPLLSLVVTVRPIFSCSGFLVSAATRVYAFTCASLCLSSIGGDQEHISLPQRMCPWYTLECFSCPHS